MKKRLISLMLIIFMLATCLPTIALASAPQIKNIIFMIPDGAGYNTYDLANYVKVAGGFDATKYPNRTITDNSPMALRSYLVGSAKTYCADDDTTDSAAAGTALATGHKTNKGYLGVNPQKKPVANLLEAAQSVGKATGIVATYEWMHATPASFGGHAVSRSDYYNLYQQIENKGINVVLGAGYGEVSKYATIQNARDRGYTIIATNDDLKAVKPGDRLWGNVSSKSLPYDYVNGANQPSLPELVQGAITALSADEDGFFLMVEGSKVDTGGHAKDAVVTTSEYIAFDEAFRIAVEFAKGRNDTIVIATPDHDTGGMKLPEDIAPAVADVKVGVNPSTVGWTTSNHTNQNVAVWMYVPEGISVIPGLNSTPGDTDVTRGDYKNRKGDYVIDNIDIAPYLASLMGVDLAKVTEDLFVDVTRVGVYDADTETFTFNNGDGNKYVKLNQSHYFKNGQKIQMPQGTMVYINNRVYVPRSAIEEGDLEATGGYDGIAGSGTLKDPYIIADEYDFMEFSDSIASGNTYEGKYLKQTEHIDLAPLESYAGLGKEATFAGTYDGSGYTININHTLLSDKSIFPYTTGTIMNLGTTGVLNGSGTVKGGIARSIRSSGKMVNCYSTVIVKTGSSGGLAGSNDGSIVNCYYAGSVPGKSSRPIVYDNGGTLKDCYYSDNCGATTSAAGAVMVDSTTLTTTLAETLDNGRAKAAEAVSMDIEAIGYWRNKDGKAPVLYFKIPTVTSVTVEPEMVMVDKGDGYQFTATVSGEYNPSNKVKWAIEPPSEFEGTYILDDGYLVVDPRETMSSFTVLAKSAVDGSVAGSGSVTVGDRVHTERDGSRARPFLINSAEDFAGFTEAMAGGNTFAGKYFKQVANIDMTNLEGYNGVGGASAFAGIYDGNGYSINVNISSDADNCVFPTVSGTIHNVGITGKIKGGTVNGGIAKELTAEGVIANCWTSSVLEGADVGGIVFTNNGKIANCYVGGSVSGSGTVYKVMSSFGKGSKNNYFKSSSYTISQSYTQITSLQMRNNLTKWLNDGIKYAVEATGFAEFRIAPWSSVAGRGPRHENSAYLANSKCQAFIADATYADGNVSGTVIIPSNAKANVAYVVLYTKDGSSILGVQRKSFNNGLESIDFSIPCGALSQGDYTLKLMMWDNGLGAHMIPDSMIITVQ